MAAAILTMIRQIGHRRTSLKTDLSVLRADPGEVEKNIHRVNQDSGLQKMTNHETVDS